MKKRKFFSVLVLAFVLVFTAAAPAFALDSAPVSQKVMFNGSNLDFKAAPSIVNGRIMVPLDEFNDSVVKSLGQQAFSESDFTSAYINDSTMVPLRSLCDELGLSLSWDASARTAVIIDFDSLFDGMDETYSILNKLMLLSYDPDTTYLTVSDSSGKMKVDPGSGLGSMSADISAKSEMLNSNVNMSGTVHMKLQYDLSQMAAQLSPEELSEIKKMLAPFEDIEIQIIFNAAEEVLYIQLGALGDFIGAALGMQDINGSTWIKADFTSLVESSGYADLIRAFINGDPSVLSIEQLMQMVLNRSNVYQVGDYEELTIVIDMMAELFSDKAFVVSGSDDQPTYELTLNTQKLNSAMVALAVKHPSLLADERYKGMGSSDFEKLFNYDMKMRFTVKGPHEYTASLSYQYDIDMADLLNSLDESGAPGGGSAQINMNVESEFPGTTTTDLTYLYNLQFGAVTVSTNMTLKDTSTVSVSDKIVLSAPPAGAKIYDVTALFSAMF